MFAPPFVIKTSRHATLSKGSRGLIEKTFVTIGETSRSTQEALSSATHKRTAPSSLIAP